MIHIYKKEKKKKVELKVATYLNKIKNKKKITPKTYKFSHHQHFKITFKKKKKKKKIVNVMH